MAVDQEQGQPGDDHKGDWWDHVAYDPEHKLVLAVVPGARVGECAEEVVEEVKERLGDRPPELFTSDEHAAYESAIVTAFSEHEPTGPPAGPAPAAAGSGLGLCDGSQRAEEGTGRVHPAIHCAGGRADRGGAAQGIVCSRTINTSFVERRHGTDRGQNARKSRRSYRFSKDWEVQVAMSYFTAYRSNFCWPVRTLRTKAEDGRWQQRTPVMAAGLADHVWTLEEWINFPAIQCK